MDAVSASALPGDLERVAGVVRRKLDARSGRGVAHDLARAVAAHGGAGADRGDRADVAARAPRGSDRRRGGSTAAASRHPALDAGSGGHARFPHHRRSHHRVGAALDDLRAGSRQRAQRPRVAGAHSRSGAARRATRGGLPRCDLGEPGAGRRPGDRWFHRGALGTRRCLPRQRSVVPRGHRRACEVAAHAAREPGSGRACGWRDARSRSLRAKRSRAERGAGANGPLRGVRECHVGTHAAGGAPEAPPRRARLRLASGRARVGRRRRCRCAADGPHPALGGGTNRPRHARLRQLGRGARDASPVGARGARDGGGGRRLADGDGHVQRAHPDHRARLDPCASDGALHAGLPGRASARGGILGGARRAHRPRYDAPRRRRRIARGRGAGAAVPGG